MAGDEAILPALAAVQLQQQRAAAVAPQAAQRAQRAAADAGESAEHEPSAGHSAAAAQQEGGEQQQSERAQLGWGDGVQRFSEIDAAAGALGRFPGSQAMPLIRQFIGLQTGK